MATSKLQRSSTKKETKMTQRCKYLQLHSNHLDQRASSIYRNRPKFSVFGVGPYSFAPWKVAISGFYKHLNFRCIGPIEGKPVVLDDTCYFLPCQTEHDAKALAQLLNSQAAKGFFQSFIFWDAKRPITAQLLASLDLEMLAEEAGISLPVWADAPKTIKSKKSRVHPLTRVVQTNTTTSEITQVQCAPAKPPPQR